MIQSSPGRRSRRVSSPLILIVLGSLLGVATVPLGSQYARGDAPPGHLVISEVVTGGVSASDEFVELYNPGPDALPLEGLELVYVTASGLTVSRRASWGVEAPEVPPGQHVLIANELGTYAAIADALYASGMAATGGSVALRIQGAGSPIDAVGWGSATSAWLESRPAVAPAAGSSIERLPGGELGSTQDTDDNLADFVERSLPEPQNSSSPPTPDPSAPPATASPSPTPIASTTPAPTPTSTSAPAVVSVATARTVPDGTEVTVEASALTGSGFAEGGGYVADPSGGIAVLLSSGAYERGGMLRVTGIVDDRFAQRTLRASGSQIDVLGPGVEPEPLQVATGAIGESVEGRLVHITGSIAGAPATLSAGLAYDVDDGTGATRVVVGSATGIDTAAWSPGSVVDLVGVVGQRDSSGTGAAGYRVQPRDPADVITAGPPTPAPSASSSPDATPTAGDPGPSPTAPPDGVISIADARAAPKNARVRVRGVVTLPAGIVDPVSAVIQDATAAIMVRLGDEVGPLLRGDLVQVEGVRSTLSGMETLRVTRPAVRLGAGSEPDPAAVRTGEAGEPLEAALVTARGGIVANARRVASGTVSFEIDDGSGPLRIYLAASLGAEPAELTSGTWVTVTGVLGQETTGAQPLRGYRVWPRSPGEVRVLASTTSHDGGVEATRAAPGGGAVGGAFGEDESVGSLAGVGGPHLAGLRIGATLVQGPWNEIGIAGLLWDGERLVAIDAASTVMIERLLGEGRPPLSLKLGGLRATGTEPTAAVPMVALSPEAGDVTRRDGAPAAPAVELPDGDGARWISVIGRVGGSREEPRLQLGTTEARLEVRCDDAGDLPAGVVSVSGIGLSSPARIVVPCGAVRPVPVLGQAGVLLAAGGLTLGHPEATTAAMLGRSARSPRAPTALLLGAGAVLLGAVAVSRRLRDGEEADAADAGVAGGLAAEPAEEPLPHPLALVGVPHERGSP